jgi:hypothetical protein
MDLLVVLTVAAQQTLVFWLARVYPAKGAHRSGVSNTTAVVQMARKISS